MDPSVSKVSASVRSTESSSLPPASAIPGALPTASLPSDTEQIAQSIQKSRARMMMWKGVGKMALADSVLLGMGSGATVGAILGTPAFGFGSGIGSLIGAVVGGTVALGMGQVLKYICSSKYEDSITDIQQLYSKVNDRLKSFFTVIEKEVGTEEHWDELQPEQVTKMQDALNQIVDHIAALRPEGTDSYGNDPSRLVPYSKLVWGATEPAALQNLQAQIRSGDPQNLRKARDRLQVFYKCMNALRDRNTVSKQFYDELFPPLAYSSYYSMHDPDPVERAFKEGQVLIEKQDGTNYTDCSYSQT